MGDILFAEFHPESTVFIHLRDEETGQIWDGAALENYNAPDYASYEQLLTEDGKSGYYKRSVPAQLPAGFYRQTIFERITGVEGEDRLIGGRSIQWDGTNVIFLDATKLNTLHDTRIPGVVQPQTGDAFARLGAPAGASVSVDMAAVKTDTAAVKAKTDSLPEGIKKNQALNNFEFEMIDSTDNVSAKTGLTVSGQRSIDGAAFSALANSVTEVGFGTYKVDLAASDLNGDIITLRFTATGADDRKITIKTSP